MRWFFPQRRVAAGRLSLELGDDTPGTYETLQEKYFLSMTAVREELEEKLGELRMADVTLRVLDKDRKFRDTILTGTSRLEFRVLLNDTQSLFTGYVNKATRKSKDKSDLVDFTAFSPLNVLSTVSIADLYAWLRANGYERTVQWAHGGYVIFMKGIRLRDVLHGIARMAGLSDVLIEHFWTFHEANYPMNGGDFLKLWILTNAARFPGDEQQNMFDPDLERSPMSFAQFENCRTLLKHLCQMFFSHAYVQYVPELDHHYLIFKQRGSSDSDVTADGTLLSQDTDYIATSGIIVRHLIGRQGVTFNPTSMQSNYGTFSADSGLELELPLKTHETPDIFNSGTADGIYSYLHVEIPPDPWPPRNGIGLVGHVTANRFPTYGLSASHLHKALAESYGLMHVGERARVARTYHGVTATKNGSSNVAHFRVGEVLSYVHHGVLYRSDISVTEIDPFKNTTKVFGVPRT